MAHFLLYELFPTICNMSLTASIIIVFVLLARLLLKKAPKVFSYALWAVVLFRLLCPISFTSSVSLLGLLDTPVRETTPVISAVEYIQPSVAPTEAPQTASPVSDVEQAGSAALPQNQMQQADSAPVAAPTPASALAFVFMKRPAILTCIWFAGILAMLLYSLVSFLILRRKLIGATPLRGNIYLADHIGSPFVMGVLRPNIYLPSSLSEREQAYIILHEQYHIRRRDHIIKVLAFAALCVHWFNPLVWVAFVCSGKDMEMSCDEAVVKKLGTEIRADYSASLLSLATGRRIIAGTPLAFGEGDTKGRIKNMMTWKKPKLWAVLLAVLVCTAVLVVCAANPHKTASGQYASMEDFAQQTMDAAKTVTYYTTDHAETTGNVTGTKLAWLEKQGEIDGLAPEGTLKAWTFNYLVQVDAEPDQIMLVGSMYEENGWYDLEGQDGHNIVALRYEDGTYDILYDQAVNDNIDFYGYHLSYEEAIYDWYVTENGLDLPLYVQDWIDQITIPEPGSLGNFPVHRYDGDGWYLYVPVQAWYKTDKYSDNWMSSYDTGSALTVYKLDYSAQEQVGALVGTGWIAVEDTVPHVRHSDYNIEDYYYDAPDGGCYQVRIEWQSGNITDYPYIAMEPNVLALMAKSFTADERMAKAQPDAETLRQIVNGIFVGALSYDETWETPGNYTLTATDNTTDRIDTYPCAPQAYYSADSTPGGQLLSSFDWSAADASGDSGSEESDYTFRFENGRYAITVYSRENKLKLTDLADGSERIFVGTPHYPNENANDFSEVFLTFTQYAIDAEYEYELGSACSVSGAETDYAVIAQKLAEQYAQGIPNRPGWYRQTAQDAQVNKTEVFDAYYGEENPNFCFRMGLSLKVSDDQSNFWQAGAGLSEPAASGPYAGYYGWGMEVNAAKGPDGNWHITGMGTGGASVFLPYDLDSATVQQLTGLYFLTSGQTHDWRILYRLAEQPLDEVRAHLNSLESTQRQQLKDGILAFMAEYPDYCTWSASDFI